MNGFNFDDIRPYRDDEIEQVLQQLVEDREFVRAIGTTQLPRMQSWAGPLAEYLVRRKLRQVFAGMHSISDFQMQVEGFMDANLRKTTSALTTSGVDHLDPGRTYLFICNHRDIVMDPALCNLILHRAGRDTFRIAIGDNLLSKPFAEHLMRINKSFVVRRSVQGNRQKFLELRKLSAYIRKSILDDGQSVWIAHREGRAKDGIDRTDVALLKMLALSGPEDEGFGQRIRDIHMVPVALSYQWDPCDAMKANELAMRRRDGVYRKGEFEDIRSIALGIQGWKGAVHVAFGGEINWELDSADDLAVEIDRQIIGMYRIQSSHLAAWYLLRGGLPAGYSLPTAELDDAVQVLRQRMQGLDEDQRHFLLHSYANPIQSRIDLELPAGNLQ